MTARKNAPRGTYRRPARANPRNDCPMTATFAAVGGRWKLTLVYWLSRGELHFAGLQRRAAPVSHKVLAEQLRELEADGIVVRLPSGEAPAPVHYRLTAYGRTLLPMVEHVRVWGLGHLRRTGGAGPDVQAPDCATPIDAAAATAAPSGPRPTAA